MKNKQEKTPKKNDVPKEGIILQSEDHIKIVDKTNDTVILDKRG